MADYPLQFEKAVSTLPSALKANTFYPVRVGQGYDLYLSDTTGQIAYKPNVSVSQIVDTLPIGKGGTSATDVVNARKNLGFGNAKINNQLFDCVSDIYLNRYSNFKYIAPDSSYAVTTGDVESVLQVYQNTNVYLPASFSRLTSFLIFHCGELGTGDASVNVPSGSFIYHPATGMVTSSRQLLVRAGETVEILNRGGNEYDIIGGSYLTRVAMLNVVTNSIKSGQASYKKGWRALSTVTLPSQAGETVIAHGVTNLETIQGSCVDSDGFLVLNNDIDPARQFYIRAKSGSLYVGVTANSSKVFGKTVQLFVGELL